MPRSGMARWKGSCIRTFITYCPIPSVFVVVFCTTSNLGDYLFPPGLPSGMHVCMLSPFSSVRLFVTLWTVACQASLFMGFSRQEYWNGWPCPPPGDLPDPGRKPTSPGIFFKTVMGIIFNWVDLKLRLRKLENYMGKNEIRTFSNTI